VHKEPGESCHNGAKKNPGQGEKGLVGTNEKTQLRGPLTGVDWLAGKRGGKIKNKGGKQAGLA